MAREKPERMSAEVDPHSANGTEAAMNGSAEDELLRERLDCHVERFNPYLYHKWFEGVLVAAVAIIGVVGNLVPTYYNTCTSTVVQYR